MSRRRKYGGLTPKQRAFSKEILKQVATTGDINGTEAALKVYDTTDRATAGDIASTNLSNPQVSKTIEDALDAEGLSLNRIAREISGLATSRPEKISADVKLKANIELLKLLGAYPTKESTHFSFNFTQKIKDMSFTEAKQHLAQDSTEATTFIKDAEIL